MDQLSGTNYTASTLALEHALGEKGKQVEMTISPNRTHIEVAYWPYILRRLDNHTEAHKGLLTNRTS